MKTGLVMEGGAFRTIFSAGVCDAMLDAGLPLPDYLVGVFAGITYGVSYLSRQRGRNLRVLTRFANDPRYMGMRNYLLPGNRSYFGLQFSYETIPNQLDLYDHDAFEAYAGEAEAVVTNLITGQPEYMPVPRRDWTNKLLQASCALPIMFPIYHLNDQPYLDGGCSDAIPWKRAFDAGCDRVVVLLTRERAYQKESEPLMPLLQKVYSQYPAFLDTLASRAERYNRSREELFQLEREGRVLVLAPEDTTHFSRTERDLEKIRTLWQDGYFAGHRQMDKIRDFWFQ